MTMAPAHAWIRPVPNVLTFLRLVLAGVLPLVPPAWRLPVILAAAASDGLDGWIARRFHAITDLGRLLDGVADKAVSLAVVVTLTLDGTMRPWEGLLVLARDLVVAALAVWLALTHAWAGFRHMQVRWAGKLTTLLVFAWFATLLLPAPAELRTAVFVLAAGASLLAAADYLAQAVRLRAQGTP
jgi:phosphatidylglycerophosphate synthase